MYLRVYYKNGDKVSEEGLFFDKIYSCGRILDAIAKIFGVENKNHLSTENRVCFFFFLLKIQNTKQINKSTKIYLFDGLSGARLDSSKDLISQNIQNGQTIILARSDSEMIDPTQFMS